MNDKQIDNLREDLKGLKGDMQDRFNKLENKIDESFEKSERKRENIRGYCRNKRSEIYEKINENREEINDLDNKLVKLFFIGSGIGYVLGTITSAIIMRAMEVF